MSNVDDQISLTYDTYDMKARYRYKYINAGIVDSKSTRNEISFYGFFLFCTERNKST